MAVYSDLVRYRELFANLFRRDFQAKYRGSALGVLWSLVNPIALMGVYLVVCHELAVRYGVNAAGGSSDLDRPVHDIANAIPYIFDEVGLQRAITRIREVAR